MIDTKELLPPKRSLNEWDMYMEVVAMAIYYSVV